MLDIYIGSNLNPHTKFGNIGKRTQIILISAMIVDTIPISTLMIKKSNAECPFEIKGKSVN